MLYQAHLIDVFQSGFNMGRVVHKCYSQWLRPQLLDNKTDSIILLASQQAAEAQRYCLSPHQAVTRKWPYCQILV